MGCSESKEENLPLVVRCRERQELIRAAANNRYALAAAHVSYLRSLKEFGDALVKFVDEGLVVAASSSSSSLSSPSLTLPRSSKKNRNDEDESPLHLHDESGDEEEEEESHLHLSDSSSEEDGDSEEHCYNHHSCGHDTAADESSSRFPHVNGFSGYVNGFVNVPYTMPNFRYGESYSDNWGLQGVPPAAQPWLYSDTPNMHYMKKSAPATKTVVQDPPAQPAYGYSDSYWNSPVDYGGNYVMGRKEGVKGNSEGEAPPPPSPKAPAWDFLDPFTVLDVGYPGYSGGGYGHGSNYSSPDLTEVRKREGIPDLEEETETEAYKEVSSGGRVMAKGKIISGVSSPHSGAMHARPNNKTSSRSAPPHKSDRGSRSVQTHKSGGSSKSGPSSKSKRSIGSVSLHKIDSSSKSLPSRSSVESERPSMRPHNDGNSSKQSEADRCGEESVKQSMPTPHVEGTPKVDNVADGKILGSINLKDDKSRSESKELKRVDEGASKKKGVTFQVEETSNQDGDSSKIGTAVTFSSPRGTRDLREVVAEIRDEFETASSYGKEVALMLEVGKLPYQPSFLKAFMSRLLYGVSPSMASWDSPSKQSAKVASSTVKLAKSYFEDVGKDVNLKAGNLSSTLDWLCAWEKKLYKEVKDEERLRVKYEKQQKKLKTLEEEGAEPWKIDDARFSVRRLLAELDVSIKAIATISSRIHKLRDEVLQPQLTKLVHGLTRMWKAMLKCHQKQFQAVMESRMRRLKSNIDQTDSGSRAATALERELCAWRKRFNEWIHFQRSYVESLNEWLIRCLQHEPEEAPGGPVPYSPSRLGAPPIFVVCNDWHRAMEAISEGRVAKAMNTFTGSLQQLREKQCEEGRQRLKAECLSKNYQKHLRAARRVPTVSDENGLSVRQRLAEERLKHKDAVKLVHEAASGSLNGGLVPIFKALESFTSEAAGAYEHVRVH